MQRQRVERRELERRGLVIVQRHDPGFPVEDRVFAPFLAAALDGELVRLQARGGDQAAAFELALPAQEQRGQPFGFPDREDLIFVARCSNR